MTKRCETCKKEYKARLSRRRFCSYKCRAAVLPPPLQGALEPKTCVQCKETYTRKGVGVRAKSQFCSTTCASKFKSGKKHWNWQGGITPALQLLRHSPQYNEWRKAVYARDYWTCQMCKVKQKHPIAHHMKTFKDYPSLRFEVTNGQTLCRSCHLRHHKEIGMNTRFQLAA